MNKGCWVRKAPVVHGARRQWANRRTQERNQALLFEVSVRRNVEDELRQSLDRMALFNRVISAGTSTLEPEKILEVLCTELAAAMHVKQASFALLDDQHRSATVIAEYYEPPAFSVNGLVAAVRGNPQAEQLVINPHPFIVTDLPGDLRRRPLDEVARSLGFQSMLVVPLVLREKVLGLFSMGIYGSQQFTPEEIELIHIVTTAAGQVFENARLYAKVQRELEERRQIESRLLYQSTHDCLTDLYNRMYFEEELRRIDASGVTPVSFIMLDMDQLKMINDNLGHIVGDDYLRRIASVLKAVFRQEDVTARLGGDEFAVILKGADEEDAAQAAFRLRLALLSQSGGLPAGPARVSIGVATVERGGSLIDGLKQADHDMYQDKLFKRTQSC